MPQYITSEGLKKLKEELEYLKTVGIRENASLLKYAASFGDLKENAGYHDAKDRQGFLMGRIEQLENTINDCIVQEKGGNDTIQLGSGVEVSFDGKKENYEIVAPGEANILKNKVSYESPMGKTLMGKKVGEEFTFNKIKVKILKIS